MTKRKYKFIYKELLRPFGSHCWYCGSSGKFYTKKTYLQNGLQIDHIIPTSHGGVTELDNLTLSCPPCNRAKNELNLLDFYEYLDHIRGHHPLYDPTLPHPTSSLFIKVGN